MTLINLLRGSGGSNANPNKIKLTPKEKNTIE